MKFTFDALAGGGLAEAWHGAEPMFSRYAHNETRNILLNALEDAVFFKQKRCTYSS
jgi:hypothetical protein